MDRNTNNSIINLIKTVCAVFLSVSCLSSPSFSAYTWVTKVTSSDVYHKIVAITPQRAFVVGDGGKIGYTSNYGDFTFTRWDTTNASALKNVFFYTTTEAKIVGDGSTIISATYTPTTGTYSFVNFFATLVDISFEGVAFTSDDSILTVSGYDSFGNGGIWRTSDGAVWNRVLDELNSKYKRIFCSPTAMTGIAAGTKYTAPNLNPSIIQTSDGTNWAEPATWIVTPAKNLTGVINDMHVYDNPNKWVVGSGGLAYYYNGSSWADRSISGGPDLRGVHFLGATDGWAVGDGGKAYHTTDGGVNWSLTQLDSGYTLESVSLSGEANGWIVGKSAAGSKIYYLTTVPSSLEIQNIKLDGVTLESSSTAITTYKSNNQSAIHFEILGTSSVANFPLTAEVVVTKSGSTPTAYPITASEIATSEGGLLATIESKALTTFEVGTYTCVVNAYYTTLTATKTFTLTVSYQQVPVDPSKPISSPIPSKVFTSSDTTATFTVDIKADVLATLDLSKIASVIVAPGIEDVVVSKATIVPHAGSMRAYLSGAATGDSVKATLTFNLPQHLPRAIYSFILKDERNGAGLSRPSRFAYAKTSN